MCGRSLFWPEVELLVEFAKGTSIATGCRSEEPQKPPRSRTAESSAFPLHGGIGCADASPASLVLPATGWLDSTPPAPEQEHCRTCRDYNAAENRWQSNMLPGPS